MENKKNTDKKRYWAFVLYLESAPEDWREQLQQTGLPIAISPYHDKDIDPTGAPKKPHYHVILAYSGPTTFAAVERLTKKLNQPMPIALDAIIGMYRYHIHIDNPDKYQYDDRDRIMLNGFNIADFCELSKREVNELKIKIQKLIRDADIREYAELMDVLLDSEMLAEYDIACNHTLFFDRYIASRRHGFVT